MRKLILSICLTTLTLGGFVVATLPLSAATNVKKSANPELVALSDGEDALLKTDLSARQLEKTPVKKGHTMPALKVLPSRAEADQTTVTLLDSMVTTVNGAVDSKTAYAYDDFGRTILYANLTKSTTSEALDTLSKQMISFDNEGNEVFYASYRWNSQSNALEPMEKQESVFGRDASNNLTMVRTQYFWMADSAKWTPIGKQEATFMGQSDGPYKSLIDYQYIDPMGWVQTRKISQFENVDGYTQGYEEYRWDVETNSWVGINKRGYVLDELGEHTLLQSTFSWSDSLAVWGVRHDEQYDANDRVESTTVYHYAVVTKTWLPIERNVMDYDGDQWFGELTIIQQWDQEKADWINVLKQGTENDLLTGRIFRFVQYTWDDATESWVDGFYWNKGWDDAGNLTEEQRYVIKAEGEWANIYYLSATFDDLTDGVWLITSWMESEFNLDGQQTSYTQMWRSSSLDPWYENYTYKQVSVFNELGDRTLVTTYYWDETVKAWYLSWKRDYAYNDNGDYTFTVRSAWTGSDWNEVSRNTYYYSQKLVGVQAIQVRLDVYPNPVADRLVIKGAAEGAVILVRDLNGRTLRSLKAVGEETSVEMSTLPAGMYLVQVGKQVVKIVK